MQNSVNTLFCSRKVDANIFWCVLRKSTLRSMPKQRWPGGWTKSPSRRRAKGDQGTLGYTVPARQLPLSFHTSPASPRGPQASSALPASLPEDIACLDGAPLAASQWNISRSGPYLPTELPEDDADIVSDAIFPVMKKIVDNVTRQLHSFIQFNVQSAAFRQFADSQMVEPRPCHCYALVALPRGGPDAKALASYKAP